MQSTSTPAFRKSEPPKKNRVELALEGVDAALEDYHHMADELEATKRNLEIQNTLVHRLNVEAEGLRRQIDAQKTFFTEQIDALTAHRDRLAITIRGMLTRYKVIRECFHRCEQEALEEGLAANEPAAEAEKEDAQALKDLGLDDPSRSTHERLPIVRLT